MAGLVEDIVEDLRAKFNVRVLFWRETNRRAVSLSPLLFPAAKCDHTGVVLEIRITGHEFSRKRGGLRSFRRHPADMRWSWLWLDWTGALVFVVLALLLFLQSLSFNIYQEGEGE